jgi:hypothetical protein
VTDNLKEKSVKVLRTLVLVALVCALSSGLAAARHFKFVQFDITNSSRTNLFALNDSMVLTGTYRTDTPDGPRHGFIVGPHIFKVIDDVAYPAGTTVPVVTGDYVDSNNVTHGFTYRNGTYTPLDYPGALATFVYGVNDAGVLTLLYFATDKHTHATILAHGNFLAADVPGATDSFIHSVNIRGAAVYSWSDNNAVFHGALRRPSGRYVKFDAPGATNGTFGDGINDFGVIVGVFRDATTAHGFIAIPRDDSDEEE